MAELATAGSVVGLISLSISCCEGLTRYYSNYKSYSNEVNQMISNTEEVGILCQNIKREMEHRNQLREPVTEQALKLVAQCHDNIRKLNDALGECRTIQLPQDLATRVALFRAKALYPFKKRTIQILKEAVEDVQKNLGSVVQVLQLQISSGIEKDVQNTQSSVQQLSHPLEAIRQVIPGVKEQNDKLAISIDEANGNVQSLREEVSTLRHEGTERFKRTIMNNQSNSQSIETAIITKLNEQGAERETAISHYSRQVTRNTEQMQALDDNIKKLLVGLINKPGLLRSVCDTQVALYEDPEPTQTSPERTIDARYRRKYWQRRCTCERNSFQSSNSKPLTIAVTPSSRLSFSLKVVSFDHVPSCPEYKSSSKRTASTTTYNFSANLIFRAIRTSTTINRGAGGCSIGQKLEAARLVPSKHPGFELVKGWQYGRLWEGVFVDSSRLGTILRNSVRELDKMFRDGTASPYDVDCDGNTLLHAACDNNFSAVQIMLESPHSQKKSNLELAFWFYNRLAELGVPLNWASNKNFTLLDMILYKGIRLLRLREIGLSAGLARMIDNGAQVYDFAKSIERLPFRWAFPRDIRYSAEAIEALHCSELSVAVLKRSEVQMQRILSTNPESINQPNSLGQTPLHLAVDWPFGVRLLLRSGATIDSLDRSQYTPLRYALERNSEEVVNLLMNAGSGLDSVRGKCFSEAPYFISLLAERRRKLYDSLVTASIPEEIDPHLARNDRLLDEHAPWAEEMLSSYEIPLHQPSTLLPHLRTVYHALDLSTEIAEELWKAGFRDIDVPDEHHRTPITFWRHGDFQKVLELKCWLIEKGADINRPLGRVNVELRGGFETRIHQQGRRVLHAIAANLGSLMASARFGTVTRFEQGIQFLRGISDKIGTKSKQGLDLILSAEARDSCLCACSGGGCLASQMLLKELIRGWRSPLKRVMESPKLNYSILLMSVSTIFSKCLNADKDWFVNDIIRFYTFRALKLRHTCCKHTPWGVRELFEEHDLEEGREIREEDSEGIELLEELMIEFQEQRGDQNLVTFLEGYWTTKMKKVRRARRKVDLEKTREMGVVWNEEISEKNDNEEDEDLLWGDDDESESVVLWLIRFGKER